jgi:hypothetical protein
MSRNIEAPITVEQEHGETITTHPAFGQISAGRVSGQTALYGSDFMHNATIRIHISTSELVRSLSNDWHHSGATITEVELSESQWATFVSSLNVGGGVPCTLKYHRDGEGLVDVPLLPDPEKRTHQFKKEVTARSAKAILELDALADDIKALKIPQKTKTMLLNRAFTAHRQMTANIGFVGEMFDEHMENTVEKAKHEINAYATQTIMRAGIQAIQKIDAVPGDRAPPIILEFNQEGK